MKKNTFKCVDLKCICQNHMINFGDTQRGQLTYVDEDHFRFHETVAPSTSYTRNDKLYDGDFVSMVQMKNGKYQLHIKTMHLSADTDTLDLARQIYTDVLAAFEHIDY